MLNDSDLQVPVEFDKIIDFVIIYAEKLMEWEIWSKSVISIINKE